MNPKQKAIKQIRSIARDLELSELVAVRDMMRTLCRAKGVQVAASNECSPTDPDCEPQDPGSPPPPPGGNG